MGKREISHGKKGMGKGESNSTLGRPDYVDHCKPL